MGANKRVPELRFRGFSGEWEEKKLVDEVELFRGLTYSPHDIIKSNGTLVLRSSNVKNGKIVNADNVYVNSEVVNCDYIRIGDIIIVVRNGSRSLIGKHGQVKKEMKNTVIGAFMTGFHSKRPSFINALLDTNNFHQEIEKNLGATINQITNGAFKQMYFSFAKSKEQTKIGNYFQNLDKLIEQKEKKYQKLGQLKKAILEKMFPKEGATTPEIRFKGFSGEWEEKNLGEIMDVTSVKRIHQSDWTDSGIRFLRARDIVSIYKNKKPSDYLYITEEKYIEYSLISGKVKKNDLLVTGVGTIGIPMLISNNKPLYFKDGNIIWFKNENKLDGNFLYYSYINNKIKSYINISAGTGTVGTYTIDSGKKTPIQYPIKNEQTKIGNYFQKLDKLIDLHLQELQKLKNIKKASLAKMFV